MAYWALAWGAVGMLVGLIFPNLLQPVFDFVNQVYDHILGGEGTISQGELTWIIFKQNTQATLIGLFLGVVVGVLPLLVVAGNFFIIGFLFSSALRKSIVSGLAMLAVLLPHGMVELPALILGCAFGVRLGLFWTIKESRLSTSQKFKKCFKETVQIIPLLIVLLALAAFIEVYVSGFITELLRPVLKNVFK
jgi:stage II sporulation protein M